jgi:hypothetical protein
MLMRKSLIPVATAAVACAAFLLPGGEDAPPEPATGKDLFSFVRALPSDNAVIPEPVRQEINVEPPAPEAAAIQAANAFQTEDAIRRMRAQGASDDEVYRARAAAMGAENAATLARMEQEEAQWQQRVAAYLAQRSASAADAAMLQALRDRLFTTDEQARLAAYEPAVMPLTGMPQ